MASLGGHIIRTIFASQQLHSCPHRIIRLVCISILKSRPFTTLPNERCIPISTKYCTWRPVIDHQRLIHLNRLISETISESGPLNVDEILPLQVWFGYRRYLAWVAYPDTHAEWHRSSPLSSSCRCFMLWSGHAIVLASTQSAAWCKDYARLLDSLFDLPVSGRRWPSVLSGVWDPKRGTPLSIPLLESCRRDLISLWCHLALMPGLLYFPLFFTSAFLTVAGQAAPSDSNCGGMCVAMGASRHYHQSSITIT